MRYTLLVSIWNVDFTMKAVSDQPSAFSKTLKRQLVKLMAEG